MRTYHSIKQLGRKQRAAAGRPVFATRRDVLIVAALAALALIFMAVWLAGRGAGAGRAPFALVSVGVGNATETRHVPLDEDTLISIDAALPVQLEVRDGRRAAGAAGSAGRRYLLCAFRVPRPHLRGLWPPAPCG